MAGYPGKQGRKPVPTALKALRGNPGKRPLPADEPRAEAKLPKPPPELSDAAKLEWKRTGRKLLRLGVMTELDAAQFAAYCQQYAMWLETIGRINKTGVLLKDGKGGFVLNPLVRLARDLQFAYTRALAEFGMSPVSRTRVQAVPQADETDPFEALLRGSS